MRHSRVSPDGVTTAWTGTSWSSNGNADTNSSGYQHVVLHPPAGLLFIDFAGSQSLQLTGTTAIDLDTDDANRADGTSPTGGTHRSWTFTPTAWRRAPLAARLRADLLDLSPFNP